MDGICAIENVLSPAEGTRLVEEGVVHCFHTDRCTELYPVDPPASLDWLTTDLSCINGVSNDECSFCRVTVRPVNPFGGVEDMY